MVSVMLQFLLYSFLGCLLELLYARLCGQGGQGRKCLLFLPLCPVYGLGAAAILHMPPLLLGHPVRVFVAGGLLATLVELAVGLFYRWTVGMHFWDYSRQPGNVGGLICPVFTLCWGGLAWLLVYGLDPLFSPLLALMPPWLTWLLFLVTAADSLLALALLHDTGTTESLRWYRAFRRPRTSM